MPQARRASRRRFTAALLVIVVGFTNTDRTYLSLLNALPCRDVKAYEWLLGGFVTIRTTRSFTRRYAQNTPYERYHD